ncbi:MAG: hypothetical protein ACRC5A_05545 [Enterobacteriaceae bacterium]
MLLKCILVMVALACINRYLLIPRLASAPQQTQKRLLQCSPRVS